MSGNRTYDLEERLINYAVQIIEVVESLPNTKTAVHLGGQLLSSGTSPALNYGEAQAAESIRDFIHKMKIVLKELRESKINLTILERRNLLSDLSAINESNELIAIFNKSITTAKKRSTT
ncbi:four helix bundle protein [uncultured Arcticibacterium sp.]|uniref:four helix bundle protein n=1 Tax=uncultured Arcticibacterium sp. TaxID=2173042 RepID=UPI0030F870FD